MGTFNDGDSGSSIRTKINAAIQKTEGTIAISTIDVDGGAIDGVTLGTNSAVTEAQVDNININGNAITSTDINGNIALTPNGSGEVDISKVDIDAGAIDGVTIGTNSAVTDLRVDNLQLDGNTVSSTNLNGDITIDPNGTGDVNIGNFKFDADQTVGAGQDNYVLTYDNAGGKISLEAAAGGGGGGGSWSLISTTTVTTSTSAVNFTGLSGETYYKLVAIGVKGVSGGSLIVRVSRNSTVRTIDYQSTYQEFSPPVTTVTTSAGSGTSWDVGYTPAASTGGNQTECFIYDTDANRSTIYARSVRHDGNANKKARQFYGADFSDTSNPLDGLSILSSAGNIAEGTFSLYSLVT